MDIDDEHLKFSQIFCPGMLEQSLEVAAKGSRFAYYTTAETALKVLQNGELWMRNTTVMNDFSEIRYGLSLIERAFNGPVGDNFKTAVEEIFEGTIQQVDDLYKGWRLDWELETYIACISMHDASEDFRGRLSMWRAYGDTAIVVNNTPMTQVTDKLGAFSVPVLYLSDEDYEARLQQITDNVLVNRTYIKSLGQEALVSYIHNMLFITAIATKHPGFAEEKEWRLYFRPSDSEQSIISKRTECVGGVPQAIYTIPLVDDPDNGLFKADIPSLVNRIIIGPTENGYVVSQAFKGILSELGVEDVNDKVFVSDIPLRSK